MKNTILKFFFLAVSFSAASASAAVVGEDDARAAAQAFVASDPVGAAVLGGRSVESVQARGSLWIAALAPHGHLVLSGSDRAAPIVGFSPEDFAEPDSASPAYALLAGADAAARAMEASGDGERHAKWTALLARGNPKLAAAADNPAASAIVVPPFLQAHYNQWQPYNDYAPVYEPNTNNVDLYRGRCPCGCVATAAAQLFHHFRWPARIDGTIAHTHNFNGYDGSREFALRFDGHEPIDWTALETNYISDAGYNWVPDPDRPGWTIGVPITDLRGTVAESVRHPIARLILWADVLAHMNFGIEGSSSSYSTVAANVTEWYTPGAWVDVDDTRVVEDLRAGIPVLVILQGHQVLGHGWASDGTASYIYLNYGWGGSNDGYYNIDNSTIDLPIQSRGVYVGHYPRAKPQLDPLPKVCDTNLTLHWHFPGFYTNNISGFTVTASKTATATSTFFDDFSASAGTATGGISVDTDATYGYDGDLLYTVAKTAGSYTFPDTYTLTAASLLTFKMLSFAALGATYEIQARFDGGDWETILTPLLKTGWGSSGWSTERVYLGGHGGESVQFRIKNSRSSGSYYDAGKILLDDFKVTEVLAPEVPTIYNVAADVRDFDFAGLTAGANYAFTVAPVLSGALVDGETSEPAATAIAGERRTPLPGEESHVATNLAFSASDTSGTWSYTGTAADDTSVSGEWNCSISAALSGVLTASSTLTFGWTANDYYGTFEGQPSYDVLSAKFISSFGEESLLWCFTNTQPVVARQDVNVNLSSLAEQTGKLTLSYAHSGGGYKRGGVIYEPAVSNVLVPVVPEPAWDTETLTALGEPAILSVSGVSEGFYGECGFGTTRFSVVCSENVVSLEASPSHLSLVADEDVSVTPLGNGRFTVALTPSGVTEDNARSRMILTLAATDANGTTAYKDLSLRFEPVTVSAVTVNAESASGAGLTVAVPFAWLVENGLAASGDGEEAFLEAATGDGDGDGQPNWFEYVCQTDPNDDDDKLTCTIEVVDGQARVACSPGEARAGYSVVVKGTDDLSAAEWTTVTTAISPLHFFKAVIEME